MLRRVFMATKNEHLTSNTLWILGIWTFLIILGSASGFLAELTPAFIVPAVVIVFIIMVVPYFKETSLKRWVSDFGLRRLTVFHSWRIFAAFIYLTYFQHGELPELYANFAGWGALIIGFLAALAVALPFNVMRYTALHVLGLLELLITLLVAMTLMVTGVGQMENILTLPVVLIVFLGTPLSAAIHVVALHILKKAKVAKR